MAPPVNNENGKSLKRLHPVIRRLIFGDERILFFAAVYGLAAGIVFVVASSSSSGGGSSSNNIANAALIFNYPTIVILLLMNSSAMSGIASPIVQSAMLVLISTGAWTLIAFFFYAIFKMFRLARKMEEGQKSQG
ncbi:hypothetical protein [Nitrososphaera sp.]|uniref:hypothetical protein n=1 Tax=Nitrososphaera sp. TaxID=1971748 RepID=UPI00307FBA34